MDAVKRNLVVGLVGVVILLVGVLVFAQINGSRNFHLGEYERQAD